MKYIIIILFLSNEIVGKSFVPCIIGHPDKCLANPIDNEEYLIPRSDAQLINVTTQSNKSVCFNLCAENRNCFMAAYRHENRSCLFYANISYEHIEDQTYLLYFWRCCNTNTSYPAQNRCPGFWKLKYNYISFNSKRLDDPIIQIPNANLYDCQMKCLQNPICGTINIKNSLISTQIYCELIIQFPVENLRKVPKFGWDTYIWQCASNYTLPVPDKHCSVRYHRKPGYWIIEDHSKSMNNNFSSLIYFHTYSSEACLYNCLKYKHCKRAWFSLTSLFCMLESDGLAACADTQAMNPYIFMIYVWKYCSFLNKFNGHIHRPPRKCHKIIDNKHMYIYHTKCGRVPHYKNLIYPCSAPVNREASPFFENFHCQNNQSLQIVNEADEITPSQLKFADMDWVRVFTGYESFWLANTTAVNFPECHRSKCDIFNADMKAGDSMELRIIPREKWFAKKSKGSEFNFSDISVGFVIITDTERPFCNCFTVEACSYQMRVIQDILVKFGAIPYNFIVTGDGVVYKSKGWEYENKANTPLYNPDSISIALLGRYENNPNTVSLKAVKRIIQLSVEKKKLSKNYTLLLHRDVSSLDVPLPGLLRVIELWPRYRSHIKDECPSQNITIILLNIFCLLLILFCTIAFIHFFIRRIRHNKYCETVRKCRIESIYGNQQKSSIEILPQLFLQHFNDLKNVNIFISPFTCSLFWIENKLEIGDHFDAENKCQCQHAVFSIFNLCRFQSSLISTTSLVIMPELKVCSRIIAFIFERHSEPDSQCLFILHCTNFESFVQFIHQLYENQCLCGSHKLTKYVPDSKALLMGHGCLEESKCIEKKSYFNRVDMENKHCYFYDRNNCLCLYTQS